MTTPHRKKLIEVALPLPEINDASAYDKMPGIGAHPKGIHHWWARLPLPTARAILFASVVDDPSEHPERFRTEAAQDSERERLFGIIRELMQKKLHEHPAAYANARSEMEKYCEGKLPAVFDPFSGGGTIPLEAARLGFPAHAADLNPVAVLLNKCNLEIAPRWAGQPPINPDSRLSTLKSQPWPGALGLGADVRHYGRLIRARALEKLGALYPKAPLPKEHGGEDANVVAWLWTRTVASPNPAMRGRHVPLMTTFWLCSKAGKHTWVEPVFDEGARNGWRFEVRFGQATKEQGELLKLGTRAGKAQDFYCLLSKTPVTRDYIQDEGKSGRLGVSLVAIVVEARVGRTYVAGTIEQETIALSREGDPEIANARSTFLSGALPDRASITGGVCSAYGLSTWGTLFTSRQLLTLITLSDLIIGVTKDIKGHAVSAGMPDKDADAYALAVSTFLGLTLSRFADNNNVLCRWRAPNPALINLFSRQAMPMVWDFCEGNSLGDTIGSWFVCLEREADCIPTLVVPSSGIGSAKQGDAASMEDAGFPVLVSTDPPYYDNIGYATLSDFFYVWLRRTLGCFFPDVFSTVMVPKMPELTASPGRFGGDKNKAKEHFEAGFRETFSKLRERLDARFPLTVYYAFKQSDDDDGGEESEESGGVDLTTGWETMLEALISSGFAITATWPVRASQKWRLVSMGSNALASYIVLACRPRPTNAPQVGRRDFLAELKRELPIALKHLQQGNVAPVDFAQACIGPGMAVYSRYSRIIESDGRPLSVRTALALINQIKEEVLGEPESDYDPETRWALTWFDQNGFGSGNFGDANTLANAHAIAVSSMQDAGIVLARSGEVRLVRPDELPKDWRPAADHRLTVWEMTHHLMRLYHFDKAGDAVTAALLRHLGNRADTARDLAYRLFSIAERRKRSADALGYNALVLGWPELSRLAQETLQTRPAADSELNFN